jgi:N-acetylneuraminic acid mutarotase
MGVFRRMAAGGILAAAMTLAVTGAAQAAWSPAGSLTSGRYDHTATLLKDGRVLVAGGNSSGPLESAQLYDPDTNKWSDAAAMKVARSGQAAVRLESGKVLVAGGTAPADDAPSSGAAGYTRTAEIYDPATNAWAKTGSMRTGRFEPTMTLLKDGRVLVTGGSGDVEDGDGITAAVPLAGAEVYDPATGAWSDVPSMSAARSMATATLLDDGKVLVAGGYDDAHGQLTSAELFDPAHDTWSPTGSLDEARDSATATALPDGDVLVAGGDGGAGALATAEVYDPDAGSWHAAGNMAGARQTAAAALLKDGTVLVTGGEDGRFGALVNSSEQYDPATDTWTDAGTPAAARKQHTLTALEDGRALVVGGNPGGFDGGLPGVERFSSVTTTLTPASFGTRQVGTPSDEVASVLKNTGNRPLDVTDVSVAGAAAGDFDIVSESCGGASVQPGDTCEIRMRFTPGASGARSATLTVADNSTAAGMTTAALTGAGQKPADGGKSPAGDTTAGDAPAATPPAPAAGGSGQGNASAPAPRGAVLGTHAARPPAAARATCTVRTTRSHGRTRSTVTCRLTWPKRGAVALRARLMRGRTTLGSARITARRGRAQVRLRTARRLRSGRYTVVIAGRDGTAPLRTTIRVR